MHASHSCKQVKGANLRLPWVPVQQREGVRRAGPQAHWQPLRLKARDLHAQGCLRGWRPCFLLWTRLLVSSNPSFVQ